MNTKQDSPTNERGLTADQTVETVREQSRQFTQQEADYQQTEGDESKACGLCFFWLGGGQCQVVGGEINQAGLSDLYINKDEQDAAMGQGEEEMSKSNGKHETKAFSVGECKIVDEAQGIVEHLVAVMGNVDLGDDVIHQGAFTKTIAEQGRKVKVVDSHNYDSAMDAIGVPLHLWEISRDDLPPAVLSEFPTATGGLMARTQFLMDTDKGAGIFKRIKAGAIDQYSIGYDALDSDMSKVLVDGQDRTVCNLRTIKLYEYSPVVFAMNEATATVSAKSKAVTAYQDLPLAPRDMAWDASAAERRVREWAGGEDSMDWAKYRKAFFWYDQDNQEEFGGYKFPYADVIDGTLTAAPKGIFAGAGRLDSSSIPDTDKAGIRKQMSRYYAKMREEFDDDSLVPPWEKSGDEPDESKAGRMLSAANANQVINAVVSLAEVLERAGYDVPGFDRAAAAVQEDDEGEKTIKDETLTADYAPATINNFVTFNTTEDILNLKEIFETLGNTKCQKPIDWLKEVFERRIQKETPAPEKAAEYICNKCFDKAFGNADIAEFPSSFVQAFDCEICGEAKATHHLVKKVTAPEKAADNEHQAGPQNAPTSEDDVLTDIQLLQVELSLMEV